MNIQPAQSGRAGPRRSPGRAVTRLLLLFCAVPVALTFTGAHAPGGRPSFAVLDPPLSGVTDAAPYTGLHTPRRVTIRGYMGDAMEPFVTKDGKYLLFNNSNDPSVNTDLQYATCVDGLTFDYRGPMSGVYTPALEGVPSLDRRGILYFVSTRSYASTLATVYRGRFRDGTVTDVGIVPGVSPHVPGVVNFDAEISADGNTLYVVDGDFSTESKPSAARIVIETRDGDGFRRDPDSAAILRNVNTGVLDYAPDISPDGLELFFTRTDPPGGDPMPTLYRAARDSPTAPFRPPQRIAAITGFAEGPSLDADGRALYYHRRVNGRFVIFRVTR